LFLQKLFSAFPSGWPGVGLVLLRGFISATLISHTLPYVAQHTKVSQLAWIVIGFSLASSVSLIAGFMTPAIAIIVAIGASLLAVSGLLSSPFAVIIPAAAIALLGPGAYSLDARMFGRREIFVPNTSRSSKS
jgi:putative oxidoreductase